MGKSESAKAWVGFDLGGTKMLASVFNSDFEQIGRERRRTKGYEGEEAGVSRILGTIRTALKEADIEPKQLGGIGIGCPGPLDLNRGVIIETPNLGWKDVPIKKHLEKEFDCPAFIMNDVDAGVYGEYRFGAGKKARCVLGVFPGTGIGGGCVYEGKIFRGSTNSCMEIGHVQIMPNGPLCGCGRRGCLEAVASRLSIAASAAKAAYRGEAPNLMDSAGVDLSNIRSGALSNSIAAGDAVVKEIVVTAAHHIGAALGGAINLLAPDVIVMGGGLVEAMPDLIIQHVLKAVNKSVLPSFIGQFEVLPAKLGDDAGVLGAAAWAQANVESDRD